MKLSALRVMVFAFPFVVLAVFVPYKIFFKRDWFRLVAEDGVFEQLQVWFFLVASILFLVASIRSLNSGKRFSFLVFLSLSFGLALVCLEEISWGQRILGFSSPQHFTCHNVQGELTLHNLSVIQPFLHLGYILIGLIGSIGCICARVLPGKKWCSFLPGWYLSSYFFPVFIVYLWFEFSYHYWRVLNGPLSIDGGGFLLWRDQELVEAILAFGFFLFAAVSAKNSVSVKTE